MLSIFYFVCFICCSSFLISFSFCLAISFFFYVVNCVYGETIFLGVLNTWFRASWFNVNKKVQLDATVCRHLFTATSLYMFRVSRTHHQEYIPQDSLTPIRIRPRWKEVTVPLPWHTPEVADTVFSTPDDGCVTPKTCRVTLQ